MLYHSSAFALLVPAAICLLLAVSGAAATDWRFAVDEKTGGLSGIDIGGAPVVLLTGVEAGVHVEEIGSNKGKAVVVGNGKRFSVQATTKRSGEALIVTADIKDTKGGDSAADIYYQIPLNLTGWMWHKDILSSLPADSDRSQEEAPLSVVTNEKTGAGIAIAITPDTPCIYTAGCSKNRGVFVRAKIGFSSLTNPASQAKLSFAIYPVDKWGMRAALKSYYDLFPKAYEGHSKVNGLWIFHGKATTAPNPTQFSFHSLGELEEAHKAGKLAVDMLTPEEFAQEKKWGIEIYPYVIPGQREVGFLEDKLKAEGKIVGMPEMDATSDLAEAQYSTKEAMKLLEGMTKKNFTLTQDIQPIPDYIALVKNSMMIGPDGQVITRPRITAWSDRSLTFPMNVNPFIPGVDRKLNAGIQILDECRKWLNDKPWAGIYVDSLYRWGAYTNYRREHFAYAKYGLTYGDDGKPCLDNSLEHLTFLDELLKIVRAKGLNLTANGVRQRCFFHAQRLDVSGSEFGTNVTLEGVAARRSMVYQKPYMSMNHVMKSREADRRYLGRCFLFGVYGCSDMPYFSTPDYPKVKDIYDTYLPIQREMVPLGWEPVTKARVLTKGVLAERFGKGTKIFFSLYRDSGDATSADLEIDRDVLSGIADATMIMDPVSGKALELTDEGGKLVVHNIPLSADGIGVVKIGMARK